MRATCGGNWGRAMKKIDVFDSTLRDGAQGEGVSFSVEDKLAIARALDRAGVDYIEAGNPHSNPKDEEFFRRAAGELRLSHARLVAFGSTRRRDSSAGEDKNVAALLETGTACVAVFGKASEWQAREVLGTTPEENLRMIADTVAYLAEAGRRVFFDAEHFFDGYKHNPLYAMQALKAAADAGACKLILCDTNGGCFPDEIRGDHRGGGQGLPRKDRHPLPRRHRLRRRGHPGGGEGRRGPCAGDLYRLWGTVRQHEPLHRDRGSAAQARLPVRPGRLHRPDDGRGADHFRDFQRAPLPFDALCRQERLRPQGRMHVDGVKKNPSAFEHVDPAAVGNPPADPAFRGERAQRADREDQRGRPGAHQEFPRA